MNRNARGFTLVEAVIVIAITAIVAGMVGIFIQKPVEGYFDAARRADMTDTADTALRRISRELHRSLPNSVRLTGGNQVMEFLLTRSGGRYRTQGDGGTDPLDFSGTDATAAFDILGPAVSFGAGDHIVVYNLGAAVPEADAYTGNNRRTYSGGTGTAAVVSMGSSSSFPLDSPNHSFHVVEMPVTYYCNGVGTSAGGDGTGTLRRLSGYAIAAAQAVPVPGTGSLIAENVSACTFTYTSGVTARTGLVTLQLSITRSSETVSLYHQVQVSNVP